MEKIEEHTYICSGWHWSFGWLRRSELDEEYGYCYEDGDGDLVYTKEKRHSKSVYLDCWQDTTGEKYLTLSKIPRPNCSFAQYKRLKNKL
jgi:hypothetical protein